MTPAGTSNELDVQNGWEENTHTHTYSMHTINKSNAGSLALVNYCSHNWRELVSSGRLVCRCHGVFFLWCYVCFVLCFVFRLYAFVEAAAALRSIVLRYAGVPIATRVFCCCFIWRCRFFRVLFPLSLCMDYRVPLPSYVLSFRMTFFLHCDHGLDF